MSGNSMTHEVFLQRIRQVAARDTSADPEHWTDGNPLWGHCAVVSLLAQDHFDGTLLRCSLRGISGLAYLRSHYVNVLPDGRRIDFTREQFESPLPDHLPTAEKLRARVLSYVDTQRRYEMLKKRFEGK
jgi:hypothetical protein